MICVMCGKDQEGRSVEIVTGKLLASHSEKVASTTITNQTYGEFQNIEFWFCQDCWRIHKHKDVETRLKGSTIAFGASVIVFFLGNVIHFDTLTGLGFIVGLVCLAGTIYNGFLLRKTDFAHLDMAIEDPNSIFDEFKNEIKDLVLKARGATWYWTKQTWQAWVDKKPTNGRTYLSKE
jgi:hypothetical protein